MKDIEAKAREIKRLTIQKMKLEAEITSLKDEIKAEMTERETSELITDEYIIRWADVTINRFDIKAFKNKYAWLYFQFLKSFSYKKFTIQ